MTKQALKNLAQEYQRERLARRLLTFRAYLYAITGLALCLLTSLAPDILPVWFLITTTIYGVLMACYGVYLLAREGF